jgi:hypothetical protein
MQQWLPGSLRRDKNMISVPTPRNWKKKDKTKLKRPKKWNNRTKE